MRRLITIIKCLLLVVTLVSAQSIKQHQYWIDNDFRNNKTVASSETDFAVNLSVADIQCGLHFFNYRALNSDGKWGNLMRTLFYIPVREVENPVITTYEYWIDDDTANKKTGSDSKEVYQLSFDLSKLEEGEHVFSFRSKNSNGKWSGLSRLPFSLVLDGDGDPEPYAALSDDNRTLTFYYDGKKKNRNGMGIGPFNRDVDFNTWTFIINSEWYNQRESILTVEFDVSFANYTGLTSTAFWFYGCSNLKTINGLENLNTSNVETMEDMFYYCSSLTSLDVSNFNTANVTSMNSMFSGCSSLTSLDVSHFNTANVIDMYNMFGGCSSLLSLDVSHFNTVNVTSMANMFYGCSVLTSLNVSNFNTANVTEMSGMFCDCSSLTSIDLSLFNTTNVKRMGSMFYGCLSIANLDLHSFDSSNVTDMSHMFKECSSLKSLDVSSFNTSNVTDMSYMFYYCSSLTKLDVSKFNTSNVKNMTGMFDHCSSLTNLDVSGFKTDKVTGMLYMFRQCSSLISLDVSKFNTSNVTNMFAMFDGCSSLRSLDVSNFNTSNVTDMWEMFRYCSSLTNLDVSNFNTSNVTSMSEMFYECRGLTNLDVSNFDTSNVTDMFDMFSSCSSLTSLDLSRFDTRKVTTMEGMFYWCSALTTIYCNEIWQCNGYNMFYGCTSLKGAISYDSNKTDVTYANPTTGYFTKKGDKTDDLKDGDTFTANTVEGVDMTFKVISASDKTCQVGTGVALGVSIDKEYSGSISIPETVNGFRVTTVAFEAFGSSKINSVVIGNNVTYINQNAFSNCQRLKSVTFPNNNGFSLGLWPFQGCTSLETITLPKNLTSMDCNPFMGCSSLSYIGVDENNPNYKSVDGVVYSKDTKAIYAYPCGRQSTNYEIIGGTQVLGRGAFMSASKLEKIHIPNSVSQIYAQAFWECTNLKALILPPNITYISQNMATFSGIREVVIPNKVTSIESSAFSVCFNLTSVKVEIEEPLAIDENTFGNRANATLYVPLGSVDAYSKANYWKDFKQIIPIGDANGDGKINVADVVEVVNYLNGNPSERFNLDAVIQDGKVNTSIVLSEIMGKETTIDDSDEEGVVLYKSDEGHSFYCDGIYPYGNPDAIYFSQDLSGLNHNHFRIEFDYVPEAVGTVMVLSHSTRVLAINIDSNLCVSIVTNNGNYTYPTQLACNLNSSNHLDLKFNNGNLTVNGKTFQVVMKTDFDNELLSVNYSNAKTYKGWLKNIIVTSY